MMEKLLAIPDLGFNSIKVQLEHRFRCRTMKFPTEFQFHKGAIRTPATLDASGKVTLFQFHYGSIRTFTSRDSEHLYFVSIPLWFN